MRPHRRLKIFLEACKKGLAKPTVFVGKVRLPHHRPGRIEDRVVKSKLKEIPMKSLTLFALLISFSAFAAAPSPAPSPAPVTKKSTAKKPLKKASADESVSKEDLIGC